MSSICARIIIARLRLLWIIVDLQIMTELQCSTQPFLSMLHILHIADFVPVTTMWEGEAQGGLETRGIIEAVSFTVTIP